MDDKQIYLSGGHTKYMFIGGVEVGFHFHTLTAKMSPSKLKKENKNINYQNY